MPCWEIRTVTVEFKARNKELLLEALKSLGHITSFENDDMIVIRKGSQEAYIDLKAETVSAPNNYPWPEMINKIKVEYSKLAIMKAARLRKWAVRAKGENQFQLVRS